MEERMFCFQCEQTAKGTGCTGAAGVCGKHDDTANLQDKLVGALVGLARAEGDAKTIPEGTYEAVIEALFTTLTNVNFDNADIKSRIDQIHKLRELIIAASDKPDKLTAKTGDLDMESVWQADLDTRSLKSLTLFGLKGMAAYAYHALMLGKKNVEVNKFFMEALRKIGGDADKTTLLQLVLDTGKHNYICMETLDKANTEACGTPTPTEVSTIIEKGPFIIVSGHDLADMEALLKQTENSGVNVYTHCEMLPAHGYPNLKKYPHLKGNFGTAWQNQQKEFDNIPAPVLFTTNCLMPPKASYADRVYTTGVVGYPELIHIGEDRDFTPLIEKAKELGGYKEDITQTGINGGAGLTTGFAHEAVLSHAPAIIDAVKSGAIKHFFLVGGCDGARPGRNYYTEFVEKTPADTVILTLACGKYRFNDLKLGNIGELPRLLDMGQCNDSYSAIKVAVALAEAFNCGVNELPLSMILSWYEQKAVAILLTLLYLGIKNIKLGPTLPAFVPPDILQYLADNFNIAPITTAEADLNAILGA